jgi:phosphoribosyl-AMP cyclohydrolase
MIDGLKFDDRGLITAVVQDAATLQVLMVAWMNAEALRLTQSTGEAHFWSRSREELWRKGATSGNVQRVREIRYDCDGDTLLLLVDPAGPACHTGRLAASIARCRPNNRTFQEGQNGLCARAFCGAASAQDKSQPGIIHGPFISGR